MYEYIYIHRFRVFRSRLVPISHLAADPLIRRNFWHQQQQQQANSRSLFSGF